MKKPAKPAEPPKPAPRRRRPHPLGLAVAAIVKPLVGKKGFLDVDILARWAEIVGPEVATSAVPLRVQKPRAGSAEGATLVVRVGAAAYGMVLRHSEPEVLARINGHFGYAAVAKLKIELGALPPPPPPPKPKPKPAELSPEEAARCEAVSDPGLREALARLARTVKSRAGG